MSDTPPRPPDGATDGGFVLPPALSPGDRVTVLAPSGGGAHTAPQVLALGVRRLRERFDLAVRVHPTARQGDDRLRASPRARAAAVHEAFRDPAVRGVFAAIGGDDQLRVLRHVDPAVLRANPTRFYGMSDNTNLGLLLWRAGIVSFNGAQVMNELGTPGELPDYTERYCRRAFFEDELGTLEASEEWTDEPASWGDREGVGERQTFTNNPGWHWLGGDGRAVGPLWGGSAGIVQWQLAADRYMPAPERLEGAVLALEVSEERPSPATVRRWLTCMGERGLLAGFDAVLLGRVPGRSFLAEPDPEERRRYRREVRTTVAETVGEYAPDAPVVCGLDWGHTTPIAPLPLGGRVVVDPATETIRLAGPARRGGPGGDGASGAPEDGPRKR